MKLFETLQIRELDRYTIINEPISSIDLMERASVCFANLFTKDVSNESRIVVFAGPGNNGGDALAVARLLSERNYRVGCYLFCENNKISPDCNQNKSRLMGLPSVSFREINDEQLSDISIEKEDIIIDGLFGTGLNRPLSGIYAYVVELLNSVPNKVYSIDMPSGLWGEDNSQNLNHPIVEAYKTFTFGGSKLSFLLPDSGSYAGRWEVLDIGLHKKGIEKTETPFYYTLKEDILSLIQPRDKFAYKNQFGHALIVAGSRGKMGAAILSSLACLRSGVGLLTVHLPASGECSLLSVVPEAMTDTDKDNNVITEIKNFETYSAIGIGPGIGTDCKTVAVLKNLLAQYKRPLILDADALNIIAQDRELLKLIPKGSILTPHVGEFDRLCPGASSSYERLQKARGLACESGCIIVLKGAYTAVCNPDGTVHFNSTGNPGMATAGSGDVLTGILTGLLAQGYSSWDVAHLGVYLHGEAGDKAAEAKSEQSLIARDIISFL